MSFVITVEWIKSNATPRGGWSRYKLAAIGVKWPPKSGWLKNCIGKTISDDQKTAFEKDGKYISPPKTGETRTKKRKRARREQRKQAMALLKLAKPLTENKLKPKTANAPDGMSWAEYSKAFFASDAWKKLRYKVLQVCGAQCQCCGRAKADGIILNVDHILPRYYYRSLELEITNLQVLCDECNQGKGAWDETDWRTEEQRRQLEHMKSI